MWKASVLIRDRVRNVEKRLEFKFCKVSTYNNLMNQIPKLYPDVKKEDKLTIWFEYLDRREIVCDMTKYILNRDVIEIVIDKREEKKEEQKKENYILCDVKSGVQLKASYNINDLYQFFRLLMADLDCELLILQEKNNKLILLDVLDTPTRHHNECINRLIHKYNF